MLSTAHLTPLVTWADSRGHLEARELRKQGLARELLHRTGTPAHPMSPLVKLIWFSRHEPRLMGQVRWWAGLKDYVLHHLTGELVTELSSASATGLLNLKSRELGRSITGSGPGSRPTSCRRCCPLPRCSS